MVEGEGVAGGMFWGFGSVCEGRGLRVGVLVAGLRAVGRMGQEDLTRHRNAGATLSMAGIVARVRRKVN